MKNVKIWCRTCEDLVKATTLTADSEHLHFTLKCGHEVTYNIMFRYCTKEKDAKYDMKLR